VGGVALFALTRLTSPLLDSGAESSSEDPKPVRALRRTDVVCCIVFDVALVVCAAVSSSSAYRSRVLWPILVTAVGVILAAGRDRR